MKPKYRVSRYIVPYEYVSMRRGVDFVVFTAGAQDVSLGVPHGEMVVVGSATDTVRCFCE